MGTGSDGKIYYVLSSELHDIGAKMFRYDPVADQIEPLGDITEACGEKDAKTIVQGKSHVNFVEQGGKLYFATHVGYYSIIDGMEKIGIPPEGWKPYPGGHFLAFDMKTKKFEDLAKAPHGEGIITFTMDTQARPALRPDLARRPFSPLRHGEEGLEGLRAGLAGKARTARATTTARSAGPSWSIRRTAPSITPSAMATSSATALTATPSRW